MAAAPELQRAAALVPPVDGCAGHPVAARGPPGGGAHGIPAVARGLLWDGAGLVDGGGRAGAVAGTGLGRSGGASDAWWAAAPGAGGQGRGLVRDTGIRQRRKLGGGWPGERKLPVKTGGTEAGAGADGGGGTPAPSGKKFGPAMAAPRRRK